MNKRALVKKVIAHLRGELELYYKAALSARTDATDPQSKAEHKYDTRGLEASYLARGQSRQAAELERTIELFEKFSVRAWAPGEPVDLGALVEVDGADGRAVYFLGPAAGGTEVTHERQEVLVITPQSPLGQQLLGRKPGERVRVDLGGSRRELRVVSVV